MLHELETEVLDESGKLIVRDEEEASLRAER
jgi:hypothetical protein